jgi:hypothetical protein
MSTKFKAFGVEGQEAGLVLTEENEVLQVIVQFEDTKSLKEKQLRTEQEKFVNNFQVNYKSNLTFFTSE